MESDAGGLGRGDVAIDIGADTAEVHSPMVSDVAHTLLRLGRLMLVSGAPTERVDEAVTVLAQRLGYQPHLMIFADGLLLTLQGSHDSQTKLGPAISGTAVNMTALSALEGVVRRGSNGVPDTAQIERQLDAIEHGRHRYPAWLVALSMGLIATSLARLFGGGLLVVAVTSLVGIASALLRTRLEAHSVNPIAGTAILAFVTGVFGILVLKAFPGISGVACLVAAGTILVPGVPLINGMRDALGQHVSTGISRLALGSASVLSIVFGLLLAAGVTGEVLSAGSQLSQPPIGEEVLFSALAGMGFAVVFGVPLNAAWACVVCAAVGHGLRMVLVQADMSLAIGSMAGAFAAALLARAFADRLELPAVAFTFPGVVTLLPASEAFRAALGALEIARAGASASSSLIGSTIALVVTATLVIAGIAIGLSLAFATPFAAGRILGGKSALLRRSWRDRQ